MPATRDRAEDTADTKRTVAAAQGAHSRRRLFPQGLTFWAFLSQILAPGSSCRQTLRKVQVWYTARHLPRPASDTGAYNLIRALMQQAAALYHVPIERIGFKGSVDTLREWAGTLDAAHNRPREQTRLFNQLLQILAEDIVPCRPERVAPRVRKRRPKTYPLMTQPRRQYHLAWRS